MCTIELYQVLPYIGLVIALSIILGHSRPDIFHTIIRYLSLKQNVVLVFLIIVLLYVVATILGLVLC